MTLIMEQRGCEALPEFLPPPATEQAAPLSFADALRCFRAQHARPVNERDGTIEAALLIDLKAERARPFQSGTRVMTGAVLFVLWANARRVPLNVTAVCDRFDVSRATAHRWINGYKAALGMP